jgi:hypothetical protein
MALVRERTVPTGYEHVHNTQISSAKEGCCLSFISDVGYALGKIAEVILAHLPQIVQYKVNEYHLNSFAQ